MSRDSDQQVKGQANGQPKAQYKAGDALVELHDVQKIYGEGTEAEVHALRGVTLTITRGEFVAIMGTSGSGKSTLMNLLGCLDRPTHGRYVLAGREVSRMSKGDLAEVRNEVLGFVFQNFNLLARTSALENVELPLIYRGTKSKIRKEKAKASLERVGLGSRLGHTPSQLSGGQQQRVAIARALVGDPEVLLADEPTGNLDSRTSTEVMALFQELGDSGITVVLVTHEPDIAEYASRVLVVKDGLVVSDERKTPKRAVDELGAMSGPAPIPAEVLIARETAAADAEVNRP